MHGNELEIPSHVYKSNHEDTERTRLLKDVLRSSVALQADEGGKRQPRKVALSMTQAAPRSRKDRTRRSLSSAVNMRELASCPETDMLYLDMAGTDDYSLPLLTCGSRISNLYEKVQASDLQLRTSAKEADAQEQASRNSEDPADDIRIMNRPEDENPRALRARNDRVVYDFISKHARFHKLEELQENCDKAEGYEGLREVIPRRHQHHPNLALLDNKVLQHPEKLQRAMWSTAPQQTEASQMGSSLRTRRLQGQGKMKARINMQVDTHNSSLKRGNVGARSAPAL